MGAPTTSEMLTVIASRYDKTELRQMIDARRRDADGNIIKSALWYITEIYDELRHSGNTNLSTERKQT